MHHRGALFLSGSSHSSEPRPDRITEVNQLAKTVVAPSEADLGAVLDAIQGDPDEQAAQIRSRTEKFLGAENVSMMGGWT